MIGARRFSPGRNGTPSALKQSRRLVRLRRWTSISVFLIGLWVLLSNSSAHAQQVQSATSECFVYAVVRFWRRNRHRQDLRRRYPQRKHFEGSRHGSSGGSATNLEGMDGLLK